VAQVPRRRLTYIRAVTEQLGPGLYESLVTEGLRAALDRLAAPLGAERRSLRSAEAADRVALHLARQIDRALSDVGEEERVGVGLTVARALLTRLGEVTARTGRSCRSILRRSSTRSSSGGRTAARGHSPSP
jgi:hypothetical protein